jgi:hypothetical protein
VSLFSFHECGLFSNLLQRGIKKYKTPQIAVILQKESFFSLQYHSLTYIIIFKSIVSNAFFILNRLELIWLNFFFTFMQYES